MRKIILIILFSVIFSCNNLTMVDIYRRSLQDEANGKITELEKAKGGNAVLKIYNSGKHQSVGVDAKVFYLVKVGDTFIKQKNSNKCVVIRNDSIIYLDCYDFPKEIRDSIVSINEWPKNKKNIWRNQKSTASH